jgi:biopolymer transport protein ExbB
MNGTTRLLFFLATAFAATPAPAETDLAAIAEEGRREAREAMAELRDFREEVRREQLPLEERIADLRASLEAERETLRDLREARDSSDLALDRLEREVEQRAAANETADSLVREILVNRAEAPGNRLDRSLAESVEEWKSLPGAAERFAAAAPLLADAIAGLRKSVGGRVGDLAVYSQGGRRLDGRGLFFGPLLYFASADGEAVGVVDSSDPSFPRLVPSPTGEAERIRSVIRTRGGLLPVDPAGGASLALRRTEPGLVGEVRRGGIWIYPILFAAAVAVLVAAVKWTVLVRVRASSRRGQARFPALLRSGNEDERKEFLDRQPGLLRPYWETLWKTRHADPESREDLVYARLIEIRLRLSRGLAALSVIAATAPLLGLLGTVTGMISTFRRITLFGAGDPQNLSGGISEALLTTKFGLIVAIPTFLLYAFLSRRAQGTVGELDSFARRDEPERSP